MTMSNSDSYTPDRLLAGGNPVPAQGVLISGQNLARGAPLGQITTSGKLTQLDSTAHDGSQNIHSILSADCNASGGDQTCAIYIAGEFDANAVGFKDADTAAIFSDAARRLHIYFKTPAKA